MVDRSHFPTEALSSITILVVDDHLDTNKVMRLILEAAGYHVLTAQTAAEALALAKAARPHIILSDLRLPKMDGLTLVRALRQLPGLQHVVAIALTGFEHPADRQEALSAGFDAYFAKPLDFEKLLNTIRQLLGQRRATP